MIFDPVKNLISSDLAIDLGTTNTLIYIRGKGIVLNEPSVVTIHEDGHGVKKVIAVGKEAKKMRGRTPSNIKSIRPLKEGVISDFEITEVMLRHFIKKVSSRLSMMWMRIIISVPSGITQVEKRAVIESAKLAGARKVFLVEETMAAAIGAGLPIAQPTSNLIVDIGGGTTEVALISMSSMVYSKSMRVGGYNMDEAIIKNIKQKYKLLVGERTAELIKMTIGNAFPGSKVKRAKIKGRDLVTGIPKIIVITDDEVREFLNEPIKTILEALKVVLEQTPPELAADIVDTGIVLTGGGALLKNIDKFLMDEIKLPITITEDPLTTVVLGSGKILDNLNMLNEVGI
jgi:rod shape-determining protein MreB